jgi:hypothetical protein
LAISQEDAMKICSLVAAANIGVMFLLVLGIKAEAAELTVLSAIGMQSVMEDLGPKFERATGHRLAISFATAGVTVKPTLVIISGVCPFSMKVGGGSIGVKSPAGRQR